MAKRNKKAGRPKLKAKAVKPTSKRQSAGKRKKNGQKKGNSVASHLLPPRGLDFDPRKALTAQNVKTLVKVGTKAINAAEKERKKTAKAKITEFKPKKGEENLPPFVAINLRNQ
jgi:hypothetical protein